MPFQVLSPRQGRPKSEICSQRSFFRKFCDIQQKLPELESKSRTFAPHRLAAEHELARIDITDGKV